jgi:predicted Kef-type K+ transport protein
VDAIDFSGLVIVAAVAFSARLLLGLAPAVRLPAVVLEIVAGIAIGPSGLGWVELDEPIRVLSLVGLAFLLFLAGLEIDFDRLRGRSLGLTGIGFGVSFAMALLRLQDTTAQIRVRAPSSCWSRSSPSRSGSVSRSSSARSSPVRCSASSTRTGR